MYECQLKSALLSHTRNDYRVKLSLTDAKIQSKKTPNPDKILLVPLSLRVKY